MTAFLIILSIILSIIGIVGCFLPGIPGHPLNYVAMLILQRAFHSFNTSTLLIFGILTFVVILLDYFIPIWFAKKYGATKQGIIGSIIGMLVGIFFTPIGMVLGTFIGAVIGDIIAGRTAKDATNSGMGTLFGTFMTLGIKITLSGTMTFFVVVEILSFLFF